MSDDDIDSLARAVGAFDSPPPRPQPPSLPRPPRRWGCLFATVGVGFALALAVIPIASLVDETYAGLVAACAVVLAVLAAVVTALGRWRT